MKRALLIAAPALMVTARNVLAPVEAAIGRVPDDAAVYLVIARNLAAGRGFSFDGLEPTTGFHPLWLAIVALLPKATPEQGFAWLLAAYGACVATAAVLLDRVLVGAGVGRARAGLVAACAGAWGAAAYGLGMEAGAAAAAVLAVVATARMHGRPGGLAARFASGLALVLARVDLAPLALAGGVPAALGAAVGAGITLAANRALVGEAWSTAAALKGTGTLAWRLARLDPATAWRHVPGPSAVAVGVLAIVWVLATIVPSLATVRRVLVPNTLLVATALALVQLVASYLFNDLVAPWYHVPLAWLLIASATVVSVRVRGGWLLSAGVCVACLRGLALPAPGLHATVLAFARDLRALPAESRVVAEDFPGFLAWFSGRTILPADGLAASPGYRDALLGGDALTWWRARGADRYAVTRRRAGWLDERPLVDHIAPPFLPAVPTEVTLSPEAREVERVDPGSGRLFAVYRLE